MTTKAADPVQYTFLFLEQKVALMKQYQSLTSTMKDSLVREKESNLEGLLAKRQDCIDKIEEIDLSLQKVMRLGPGELSRISRELQGKLNGYLQRIKGLMERIARMDAEVMVMVRRKARILKKSLQK